MNSITVTVNGLPIAAFRTRPQHLITEEEHQRRVITEEEHQRRIVRSVQRWTVKTMRNHSGGRSSRGRVIFHQEVANA